MTGFSLRKKAVGVYFNDREVICSVQTSKDHEDNPADVLLSSIRGSRDVFFSLYGTYKLQPALMRRLQRVVADIKADTERRNKEARKALAQGRGPATAAGKS